MKVEKRSHSSRTQPPERNTDESTQASISRSTRSIFGFHSCGKRSRKEVNSR